MKGDKVKTKIKIGIILILSLFFIIMCLNIYKQSPRHIIKDTVMWYEKDFTIPLFCKKVKFEYDKKSGNYTGKFAISEKQKDSLFDNLKEFNERSVNVTNSIDKYKGNLRDLDKKTLNTTMVSYNLLYKYYLKKEKKRDDIQIDKIYPEEWMLENCDELIAIYLTEPRYIKDSCDETVLSDYSNLINGKVPRCCIVIYKDKVGKYYFCIKRTDYSDWDGPDVW